MTLFFSWGNFERYLMVTSAVIAAALLLVRWFRHPDAKARLGYLYLTLAAALTAPLAFLRHQTIGVPPGRLMANLSALRYDIDVVSYGVEREDPITAWWNALDAGWKLIAVVAAARLLWLGVGLIRLHLYRRRATLLDGALPEHLRELRQSQRIDFNGIYLSRDVSGPVTFGLSDQSILLPESFEALPAAQQTAILCHELLHIRRQDPLKLFGEEVLRAVLWFHPAVWWLLNRIRLTREQVVDEETIAVTGDRQSYLETLLDHARRNVQQPDLAPATSFFRRSHLLERVKSIVEEVEMTNAIRRANAAALYLGLALTLAAGIWWRPLNGQPRNVPDTPGVTISTPYPWMHRGPVEFSGPAAASVGTVTVQVTLTPTGEVSSANPTSGPAELYPAIVQSIKNWHFAASAPRQFEVTVGYHPSVAAVQQQKKNTEPAPPTLPASAPPRTLRVKRIEFAPDVPEDLRKRAIEASNLHLGDVITSSELALRRNPDPDQVTWRYQVDNDASISLRVELNSTAAANASVPTEITGVDVSQLPETLQEKVLERLQVRPGDRLNDSDLQSKLLDLQQLDQHLRLGLESQGGQPGVLRATLQQPESSTTPTVTPSFSPGFAAIRTVPATYPPLAIQARIQGTIRFQLTVQPDGSIEHIQLISGHPLLVPSATQAVKQFMFPASPGTVQTKVDMNYVLKR